MAGIFLLVRLQSLRVEPALRLPVVEPVNLASAEAGELLEGSLGEVEVVVGAGSAVVYDSDGDLLAALLEGNPLVALERSVLGHCGDHVRVLGPASSTSGVVHLTAGVPGGHSSLVFAGRLVLLSGLEDLVVVDVLDGDDVVGSNDTIEGDGASRCRRGQSHDGCGGKNDDAECWSHGELIGLDELRGARRKDCCVKSGKQQ